MNEADIAWAAGLFEGEGSISLQRTGIGLLSIASTDLDVLQRFCSIVGVTRPLTFLGPGKSKRIKPVWCAQVTKTTEVLRVLNLLYPWLGERRRSRADECLRSTQAKLEENTKARKCRHCGETFRPPFTCQAHKVVYCSKICEHRWWNGERKRRAAA